MFAAAARQMKGLALPGSGGDSIVRWSWWQGPAGVAGERKYDDLIGDGSGSALVRACIDIIGAAFAEAPIGVRTIPIDGGVPTWIGDHPMLRLLRYPVWDPKLRRSWYASSVLKTAVLASLWLDGNAYEVEVDSPGGVPVQKWYMPHWMLEPRWPTDGTAFISHYDYSPDGRSPMELPVMRVIHHRLGIDPNNIRKGWSPVKTVLREILTDEQAARFSAAILINLGVPGLMLSPAKDSKRALTPDEAKAVKADVESKTTGDRRGETLVFTNPTEMKTFGFSPDDLNLSNIRNVPEERVAAVMRVPAAVAGFGSGLEGVKVGATMVQLREQLWESNILPTMRTFAEEYQGQLLPRFVDDATMDRQEVAFDIRDVGALQDMLLKKQDRWITGLGGGAYMRSEVRAALGLPFTDADKIYIGQGLNEPAPQNDDEPPPKPLDAPTEEDQVIQARALVALQDEVGKMREGLQAIAARDSRPDPSVLRFIEGMEKAQGSRDATMLRGFLEVAAGIAKAHKNGT